MPERYRTFQESSMKTTLISLAIAGLAASGVAMACDDMKFTDDGDSTMASKAPAAAPVAVADKAPLVVTTKKASPVKKTAGKALPQGNATVARTN